ncbi:MAG: tetratricopeptide repeat protein [Planctomycetota bacterium]|jgi:tetratricopeptide (TPR) repeat protein
MTPRTILTLLCICPLTLAAPGEKSEFITTEEVLPLVQGMVKKLREVRAGERREEDVIAEYANAASDDKADARTRAKSMFVYGHLMGAKQRADEATTAWRTCLQVFPKFPDAEIALGRAALMAKDVKQANKHANRARKINPRHVQGFILKAEVAQFEGDLNEAVLWYEKAVEEDPEDAQAIQNLALTRVRLFKDSFNEERKNKHARHAKVLVDMWVGMDPEIAYRRVFQAQIYYGLGLNKQAIAVLESTLLEVSELNDYERRICLERLFILNAESGNLDGAVLALERIVKIKSLPPKDMELFQGRLKTLKKSGLRAFMDWRIEEQVEIMSNRGRSATERRDAMRRLLELLGDPKLMNDPDMAPMIDKVWRACVRTLSPPTPPELAIDMIQFFRRNLRDPKVTRIVVHFLYPQGVESGITENVRVEAIRTVATLGKLAAVPTLLYNLNDDSRAVTRAVDVALCQLLERRSMIDAGAGPVTQEEQRILRREWVRWAHSDVGGVQLTEAIRDLHKALGAEQGFNRKQQRNPIADHVIRVILLDNDVKWEAWEAGYLFLKDFLGRDFLPPELRGKVVTPELRKTLRDSIEKWWRGGALTQEEAENATGKAENKKDG